MADEVKHLSDAGKLMSEFKTLFSVLKTRRTMVFAYGFMFAFVAFTVFLAFNPSGNSSPWFNNIFSSSSSESSSRSQFPSIFSYLFPNSSQPVYTPPSLLHNITRSPKTTFQAPDSEKSSKTKNQTEIITGSMPKSTTNHSEIASVKSPVRNQTVSTTSSRFSGSGSKETSVKNGTEKGVEDSKNLTVPLSKQINGTTGSSSTKHSKEAIDLNSLMHCNIFDGKWVIDDSYPLYPPGSCSLIDESFNCFLNSRPDGDFQKHRWQPKGCNIPRLNGKDMLELLRGKRLVFVGDSLNRNMWESLVCILRNSVSDKSQVFEASGRHEFRTEGSYSFVFKEYNCSIHFVRSPFLVQEWEMPDSNGTKKETLRLDIIERSSDRYKNADIIVFNTGHWWTHEKTSKGKDYYQEGSHVYGELSVVEAFRKALTTWARWVDANINSKKTVVFFRGYSASHFRGGRWNSGGQCDSETDPIKNETYLAPYPPKMRALESVLKGMKTPVIYLNITRMTDYRKDGHPSIYRKKHLSVEERKSPLRYQDCSHWCLPGVPDSWNELLFAELLIKQNQMKLQQQTQQQKTP